MEGRQDEAKLQHKLVPRPVAMLRVPMAVPVPVPVPVQMAVPVATLLLKPVSTEVAASMTMPTIFAGFAMLM